MTSRLINKNRKHDKQIYIRDTPALPPPRATPTLLSKWFAGDRDDYVWIARMAQTHGRVHGLHTQNRR